MSPRVSAVLALVSEMTDEERKAVRLQLELDERATALGRKAPKVSQAILDEIERRFVNDTGPGVSPAAAVKRAIQVATAAPRKKRSPMNPR
jgi:hypothetical protein